MLLYVLSICGNFNRFFYLQSATKSEEEAKEQDEYEEPASGTTIFVKNLNFDTKQEDFKKV